MPGRYACAVQQKTPCWLREAADAVRHLLLDSLDGKVSALYEAWTRGMKTVRLVSSLDQVEELVHELR